MSAVGSPRSSRCIDRLGLVIIGSWIAACASGAGMGKPPNTAHSTSTAQTVPAVALSASSVPASSVPASSVLSTTAAVSARLDVTSVSAFGGCQSPDSTDTAGAKVTFGPSNAYDGDPSTAWRCPGHPPLGGRYGLHFSLAAPARVVGVGAIPGYAKRDPRHPEIDRFVQNDRVFNARWVCTRGDGSSVETQQSFRDERVMQTISVEWSGCTAVDFEVLDVYAGEVQSTPVGVFQPTDDTAVSEVSLVGFNPR